MNIGNRLAKLEREALGAGRVLVVEMPADCDCDADDILREAGHEVLPRDLVVRINRFSEGDRVPRRVISAQ